MTAAQNRELQQMMEDLIPVPMAAERKGCSRKVILAAGQRGEIEVVKIGRTWWVGIESLKQWVPYSHLANVRGCRE